MASQAACGDLRWLPLSSFPLLSPLHEFHGYGYDYHLFLDAMVHEDPQTRNVYGSGTERVPVNAREDAVEGIHEGGTSVFEMASAPLQQSHPSAHPV